MLQPRGQGRDLGRTVEVSGGQGRPLLVKVVVVDQDDAAGMPAADYLGWGGNAVQSDVGGALSGRRIVGAGAVDIDHEQRPHCLGVGQAPRVRRRSTGGGSSSMWDVSGAGGSRRACGSGAGVGMCGGVALAGGSQRHEQGPDPGRGGFQHGAGLPGCGLAVSISQLVPSGIRV